MRFATQKEINKLKDLDSLYKTLTGPYQKEQRILRETIGSRQDMCLLTVEGRQPGRAYPTYTKYGSLGFVVLPTEEGYTQILKWRETLLTNWTRKDSRFQSASLPPVELIRLELVPYPSGFGMGRVTCCTLTTPYMRKNPFLTSYDLVDVVTNDDLKQTYNEDDDEPSGFIRWVMLGLSFLTGRK